MQYDGVIPENVIWVEIARGRWYTYYICARGIVIRVNKKMQAQRVPVRICHGEATVTVGGADYQLKRLVAREFLPCDPRKKITHRDGNVMHCDAKNLVFAELCGSELVAAKKRTRMQEEKKRATLSEKWGHAD